MCRKKNDPKTKLAKDLSDINPIADEKLDSISGGGNPWEKVESVPQKKIDKDLRDRA